jgi:hypothetical protein
MNSINVLVSITGALMIMSICLAMATDVLKRKINQLRETEQKD